MLENASGKGLSVEQEAGRLKALLMQAMREAVESHENSVKAFQIAAMLASEAAAPSVYALSPEVGFIVRQFDGVKLGYSLDGLVGNDGLIEVKSRVQKFQMQTLLTATLPDEYKAQVAGRDDDFWSSVVRFHQFPSLWRRHDDGAACRCGP